METKDGVKIDSICYYFRLCVHILVSAKMINTLVSGNKYREYCKYHTNCKTNKRIPAKMVQIEAMAGSYRIGSLYGIKSRDSLCIILLLGVLNAINFLKNLSRLLNNPQGRQTLLHEHY